MPKGLPPGLRAAADTATILLDEADGHLVFWIEPDGEAPALTLEIDLSAAAAERVLAATGLPRGGDGSVTVPDVSPSITIGPRAGGLVLTTRATGLAGLTHDGFTTHPEVIRALAALPGTAVEGCAVVRSEAALTTAGPLAEQLFPDFADEVTHYREAQARSAGFSVISFGDDGTRNHVEASGLLAALGAFIIAQQATDPTSRLVNAN